MSRPNGSAAASTGTPVTRRPYLLPASLYLQPIGQPGHATTSSDQERQILTNRGEEIDILRWDPIHTRLDKFDVSRTSAALEQTLQRAQQGDPESLQLLADFAAWNPDNFCDERQPLRQRAYAALQERIESGHATEVLQAILKAQERESCGKNDPSNCNGDLLTLLASAASQLDASCADARQVKERLLQVLEKPRFQIPGQENSGFDAFKPQNDRDRVAALRGLALMSDHLGSQELRRILPSVCQDDAVGLEAARTLQAGLDGLEPAAQHRITSGLWDRIRGAPPRQSTWGYDEQQQRADRQQKLEILAPFLGPEDLRALSLSHNQGACSTALASDSVDEETRLQLLHAMRGQGADQRVIDYALQSRDPAVRSFVADKLLDQGPNLVRPLSELGQEITNRLATTAMRNYASGYSGDLAKLGELFEARRLAGSEKFRGQVDLAALDKRIQDLMASSPELQKQYQQIASSAAAEWRATPEGQSAVKQHMAYLASEDFQNRLALLDPEQKRLLVQSELQKARVLDPERAQEAAELLNGGLVLAAANRPLDSFAGLSQEECQHHLDLAVAGIGLARDMKSFTAEAAKILSSRDAAGRGDSLTVRLQELAEREGLTPEQLARFRSRLDFAGMGLGLVQMGMNLADFKVESYEEITSLVSNGLQPAGKAVQGAAILARANPELLRSLSRCSEFLGPVGDALGTSLDVYKACGAFASGDQNAGLLHSGAAAAGLGSMGCGIAALCMASGPVGWVGLGLGVAAFGLGAAADSLREGDDLQLLRRVDSWTPAAEMFYGIQGWLADDGDVLRKARSMTDRDWETMVADYQRLFDRDLREDLRQSSRWSTNDSGLARHLSYR